MPRSSQSACGAVKVRFHEFGQAPSVLETVEVREYREDPVERRFKREYCWEKKRAAREVLDKTRRGNIDALDIASSHAVRQTLRGSRRAGAACVVGLAVYGAWATAMA